MKKIILTFPILIIFVLLFSCGSQKEKEVIMHQQRIIDSLKKINKSGSAVILKEVILTNNNRETIEKYAAEKNQPFLDALQPICDHIYIASAREDVDFNRTLLMFLDQVESKSIGENKSISASWNELWEILNGGTIESFSAAMKSTTNPVPGASKKCSGQCKVFYQCAAGQCQLCQVDCDSSCKMKCSNSTGCRPPCEPIDTTPE